MQIKQYSNPLGFQVVTQSKVTQLTSRATGVTANGDAGQITTNNTSLAAGASAVFVVTNENCGARDIVVACVAGGAVNVKTDVQVESVADGSFSLAVINYDAVTAETGSIVINWALIQTP